MVIMMVYYETYPQILQLERLQQLSEVLLSLKLEIVHL